MSIKVKGLQSWCEINDEDNKECEEKTKQCEDQQKYCKGISRYMIGYMWMWSKFVLNVLDEYR